MKNVHKEALRKISLLCGTGETSRKTNAVFRIADEALNEGEQHRPHELSVTDNSGRMG